MKIITISREFGSGGRELGKRMADLLGFDYYDKEIIARIANNKGLDEQYVAEALEERGWQSITLTYRNSFSMLSQQNSQVSLLLEQKKIIEEIAALGKDCIIVGRNADVILQQYQPFNIFVCAAPEAKLERCIQRAGQDEKLSRKEIERKMKAIDKARSQTRAILSDSPWGQRDAYHLTVNTTDWEIKDLAAVMADFATAYFAKF